MYKIGNIDSQFNAMNNCCALHWQEIMGDYFVDLDLKEAMNQGTHNTHIQEFSDTWATVHTHKN